MARRRDDFPPDRGLEARILVAVLLQIVVIGSYLGGLTYAAVNGGWSWVAFPLLAIGLGMISLVRRRDEPNRGRPREHLAQMVERLAAVAGVPAPKVSVHHGRAPLS